MVHREALINQKCLHIRQSLCSGYDRVSTDVTKLRPEPLSNDTRVGESGLSIGTDCRKWNQAGVKPSDLLRVALGKPSVDNTIEYLKASWFRRSSNP
jgi:hypothetical protein